MGKTFSKSSPVRDMTTGDISKHIVYFALPLIGGNLFQQLYSLVDTWVVGNYVSDEAFSAVGAVSPAMKLMIQLFMGFSTGMSIVISQYFGAGERTKVRKASHTSFVIALVSSVVITLIGLLCIPLFLKMAAIPENLVDYATEYLKIIFMYIFCPILYNTGAAILRAVGDSRKPFLFLVATAVANVFFGSDVRYHFQIGRGRCGICHHHFSGGCRRIDSHRAFQI